MQVETGSSCPFCKSSVVALIESKPITHPSLIPIGPHSGSYYYKVISFYCKNQDCCVTFKHPPGKPNAETEILKKLKEQEKEVEMGTIAHLGTKELEKINTILRSEWPNPNHLPEPPK